MTRIVFGTAKVWRALEEGKMAGIAEGVSRGYRETSEAERARVRANIIKYILAQSRTSGHRVDNDFPLAKMFCGDCLYLEICLRIHLLPVPESPE